MKDLKMIQRNPGTKIQGSSFDDQTKLAVWRKATTVSGYLVPKDVIRLDACRAKMLWSEYGNINSKNGWEIDHIRAIANGGSDNLDNLQALQWENNRAKSDGSLVCVVR